MICLITALTRSFIEKTTRKKNKQQKKQKQKFHAKTKYLNLNAPSNNAKRQSYKTLTAKIYFVHPIQQRAIFSNETMRNNKAKLKNQSPFFKPNSF